MFKYEFLKPSIPSIDECLPFWKDVYARGQFTNSGLYANKLEGNIEKYLNVKHALLVANGTLALMLAIKSISPKKSKILVPSFTFAATASSVLWMKYEPKFVDVDSSLSMSPKDLKNKIDKDCGLIIAVNPFGSPCNIDKIKSIANDNAIHLIFDSAGCFGAEYKGVKLGSFGDMECFSLHATKGLSTGEGGVITTNNKELYSKLTLYRNFGIDHGKILDEGINAKLNEFSSVLGCVGLGKLDEGIAKKRSLAQRYKVNLNGLPISFKKELGLSVHQMFPIITDERDELASFLEIKGIQTRIYYYPVINDTSVYQDFDGVTPFAQKISKKILCLPMHLHLDGKDIDDICEVIKSFFCKEK